MSWDFFIKGNLQEAYWSKYCWLILKRGCQHPSNKFEILWQVTQNLFSLLLSYFVAQFVLIIVV